MIGAHAPFTLDEETVDALGDLVARTSAPLHVHVAEDGTDLADAARRGTPLLERLTRMGALRPKTIIAHAVHLDAKDRAELARAGAWIATSARSNMNNAVGLAPARGPHVALGTDGIGADMVAEAQAHFFRHAEAKDGLAGEAVARLVGAQHLAALLFDGKDHPPRVAAGERADLAVLEYDPPHPAPGGEPRRARPLRLVERLRARHDRERAFRRPPAGRPRDRRACARGLRPGRGEAFVGADGRDPLDRLSMATLVPHSFEHLLRRMLAEHARTGAIYDLEAREIWRGPSPGFDLSVLNHGAPTATGLGPAAGPHAQLAQNIALAWLGGSRILELKTVQVNDQLVIPRPCIDASTVGYNVEWSQELTLEESLREYAVGWTLIHVAADLLGLPPSARATQLDVSVGYSLDGIRSDAVRTWLHALRRAKPLLEAARASLPRDLRARIAHVEVPDEPYDCVTLSTFHGCPAGEIEKIALHLLAEHDAHVVVKMNPTILGRARVDDLLRGTLGYDDLRVHAPAFDGDMTFDDAVGMMNRLEGEATKRGRTVGAKFTNTLVVDNHKTFFSAEQKQMYLSGPPLHVLAVQAAASFAEATGGRFALSFSGGIDRTNFVDTLGCGFVPVTTCTDLLRPGGYGRLPKYLKELEARMTAAGVRDVASLVRAQAGGIEDGKTGALANLTAYAARVTTDPRYAAAKNQKIPRRVGTRLALLDCITCDKCIAVCPNDANFAVEIVDGTFEAPEARRARRRGGSRGALRR